MDFAMKERLSGLIEHLRSIPNSSDPARILQICSELEEVRTILEANGAAVQPDVLNRILAVMIELGEAGFSEKHLPSSPFDQTLVAVQPTKEILEWARQQFTEEEIIAGIDEIQKTGGLELRDFLHELEQAAHPNE